MKSCVNQIPRDEPPAFRDVALVGIDG